MCEVVKDSSVTHPATRKILTINLNSLVNRRFLHRCRPDCLRSPILLWGWNCFNETHFCNLDIWSWETLARPSPFPYPCTLQLALVFLKKNHFSFQFKFETTCMQRRMNEEYVLEVSKGVKGRVWSRTILLIGWNHYSASTLAAGFIQAVYFGLHRIALTRKWKNKFKYIGCKLYIYWQKV